MELPRPAGPSAPPVFAHQPDGHYAFPKAAYDASSVDGRAFGAAEQKSGNMGNLCSLKVLFLQLFCCSPKNGRSSLSLSTHRGEIC